MKHILLAGCCLVATSVSAQGVDTTRVIQLNEAQVVVNRASAKSPIAFTTLDKQALSSLNYGQDIPFLLSMQPSVVVSSDAGNGIGYTYLRVRGIDVSRINVTANGIPLNDPESGSFYWVDVPDLASSLNDIQLQRGVGLSTNGAGAFGASLNLVTNKVAAKPYAAINASYGSFNTMKGNVKFGTGLLKNHWAFDGRLSYLQSDGYRDRATAQLGSYFAQAAYLNNGTTFKLLAFGGKEKTYHAWDGIDRQRLAADRTYNPNGEIQDEKKNVIGFYDKQHDLYFQQHVQALLNQRLSDNWNLTSSLHYTYGEGYYEEYKNRRKLKEYALKPFEQNGKTISRTNLVRRKSLQNHFYGGNFAFNYKDNEWDVNLGGALNNYENHHYGNVLWAKDYPQLPSPHEYYRNKGEKLDGNLFARANYSPNVHLSYFADLQYRLVDYRIDGTSDKKPLLDLHKRFAFFNPKLGLVWRLDAQHRLYGSVGMAHREPMRDNYIENFSNHDPQVERLIDLELGYGFTSPTLQAGINGYYMHYDNQFVNNGRLNEIGEAVTENVKRSFRTGVELNATWKPCPAFTWEANLTLSANRIKNHTIYVYDDDNKEYALNIGDTDISFSPSTTFNNRFTFRHKGFSTSLSTQYVGRQYLDNLQLKENSLDAYLISHLNAAYTFRFRGVKEMTIGATVYNLFNEQYEANGYAYSYMADPTKGTLGHSAAFYPMAGTNFLINLNLVF